MLATSLHAQNLQFYFGGNHHFATTERTEENDIISRTQLITEPDSAYLIEYFDFSRKTETKYKTIPGFALGMNIDWDLNERISIRSGIGFTSTYFTIEENHYSELGEPTGRTDTIPFTRFSPSPFASGCTFTNSYNDAGDPDREPRHQLLTLQVPIKLNYHIREKWGFTFGAVLRTPVASSIRYESVDIDQVTDELGNQTCTYILNEINDRSGSIFRDLTLLAEAEAYVWLGNVGLSVGGGKMFSNLFVSESESVRFPVFFERLLYRPFTGQFKMLFRFGEKEKTAG